VCSSDLFCDDHPSGQERTIVGGHFLEEVTIADADRHGLDLLQIGHDAHWAVLLSPQFLAQFLDLARVKPNTLGNTRMLITL
jgi:hypothetical protein